MSTGCKKSAAQLKNTNFLTLSNNKSVTIKSPSYNNNSTQKEKNIYEHVILRSTDDGLKESEKNHINIIDVERNFEEQQNKFFADVFKRFEGVFGNYDKRGRRVKRTSV